MSATSLVTGAPIVLYLSSTFPDQSLLDRHVQALVDRGFRPLACPSAATLLEVVQSRQAQSDAACIVWLSGSLADICTLAVRLRLLSTHVGILMQTPLTEASMLQMLHSGADQFCPADAPVELLMAGLQNVLRRLLRTQTLPAKRSGPEWALSQQGWSLVAPNGHAFALTTTERAFVSRLLQSPDRRASHFDLLVALGESGEALGNPPSAMHINRLGVLVSRMRRKFAQNDAVIPLRSVHNWGYMFAATCELRD